MTISTHPSYRYVHPYEILDTVRYREARGTQLVFPCPMCHEKASFSTVERIGRCFVCAGIIKLHTQYEDLPVEQLFPTLLRTYTGTTPAEPLQVDRVEIVTRPLSQAAWDYITSRGIDPTIVARFHCLTETTYHDRLYLAWRTYHGDYELRATFPAMRGTEKITPRGHQKHFALVQLTPEATTCLVCEGLFSALAYAQLFPRDDVWYVILNSVSNWTRLVDALTIWTQVGITHLCLALDHDPAGHTTATRLEDAARQAGCQVTCHFPPHVGDDWNDALQRGHPVHPLVAPAPVAVAVRPSPAYAEPSELPPAPPRLDVPYYQQLLAQHGKVVLAAPCGTGKTTTAAAFIAQTWRDGVLYVAERTEQLQQMREALQRLDVPPEVIGTYYSRSPDLQALQQSGVQKPIALLTHARMQTAAPHRYVLFHHHGGVAPRRLLIVDEAITPLLILSAPRLFIQALLGEMGLTLADTGRLDPDLIDQKLAGIADLLAQHAHYPMTRVGIRYLEWTDTLPAVDTVVDLRRAAYYHMLYQILAGHYLARAQDIDVLIPMAPHLTWYPCFERILILDATAALTDFLYADYQLVTPAPWPHTAITEPYHVLSGLGDLSKTTIVTHQEAFLDELHRFVAPVLEAFPDPYIVTYQCLEAEVQAVLQQPVTHYGATRGSNAYRTKASAVLLGAFRPPVAFDQLATLLFGAAYSPYKIAVAHWMQELYRTRIREGHPIKLLVLGQQQAVALLRQTLGFPLWPCVIGTDHPAIRERLLRQLKSHVQQALLTQVFQDRAVAIHAFARTHTNYDTAKVLRALRGILQQYPILDGHLIQDATHIRLIDKPIPTL